MKAGKSTQTDFAPFILPFQLPPPEILTNKSVSLSFASLFNFLTCIVPNCKANYGTDGWNDGRKGKQGPNQLSMMEYLMNERLREKNELDGLLLGKFLFANEMALPVRRSALFSEWFALSLSLRTKVSNAFDTARASRVQLVTQVPFPNSGSNK